MASLEEVLSLALEAPDPPVSGQELVDYVGGRRELTELLSGMDGPPDPKDFRAPGARARDGFSSPEAEAEYKALSMRWRTAARKAQRADTEGREGKQRRGVSGRGFLTPEQRFRLWQAGSDRRLAAFREHGALARMIAAVRVDTTSARAHGAKARLKSMPSGGPAVEISAEEMSEVINLVRQEGIGEAAAAFTNAFMESYGWTPDDFEIEDVVGFKLWPANEDEPAE